MAFKDKITALAVLTVFFSSLLYVTAGDTMTVEVDVLAGGDNPDPDDEISVQVPDKLDFGEITRGEKSEEFKVYVNNTGTVDITVTPELTDDSEDIFSYLYFRKLKTSGGVAVAFSRIGDFSFNITKPSSGSDFNDEYFYTQLDLTDYPDEIDSDMLNHQADVKFYAVAR